MGAFRGVDPNEYPNSPPSAPFDPSRAISLVPKAATEGDPNQLRDMFQRPEDQTSRVTSWGAKGTANQPTMATPTDNVEEPSYGQPTVDQPSATPEQIAAAQPPDEDKILTEQAIDAAGPKPANQPMTRGSFARGGQPGAQPGGPTGDGDSVDAPVDLSDHPVTQALVSQGVNPQLAAMLADSKRRQDQLREGQGAQLSARNAADEVYAMRAGFGIRGADEMHKSALASADLRASNVKDLQAAGDQGLAEAEKQREFTRALDMDDPNSQISQQVQAITGQKGVPASLYPQIADKLKSQAEKYKVQHEDLRNQRTIEGEGERAKLHADTQIKVANINAASRNAGKGAGKPLEQRPSTALANLATSIDELSGLSSKEGGLGPLSTLWSKVPNTDDAVWQSQREALREQIASAMAGGYRPSIPLINLIDKSMPEIGDSEATKEQKKANLLRIAKKAYNHQLETYGKTGRDVSQFERYDEGPAQGGGGSAPSGGAPAVGTRQKDKNGVLRERGADGIWRAVTG